MLFRLYHRRALSLIVRLSMVLKIFFSCYLFVTSFMKENYIMKCKTLDLQSVEIVPSLPLRSNYCKAHFERKINFELILQKHHISTICNAIHFQIDLCYLDYITGEISLGSSWSFSFLRTGSPVTSLKVLGWKELINTSILKCKVLTLIPECKALNL